jgi:hypothetical protein
VKINKKILIIYALLFLFTTGAAYAINPSDSIQKLIRDSKPVYVVNQSPIPVTIVGSPASPTPSTSPTGGQLTSYKIATIDPTVGCPDTSDSIDVRGYTKLIVHASTDTFGSCIFRLQVSLDNANWKEVAAQTVTSGITVFPIEEVRGAYYRFITDSNNIGGLVWKVDAYLIAE